MMFYVTTPISLGDSAGAGHAHAQHRPDKRQGPESTSARVCLHSSLVVAHWLFSPTSFRLRIVLARHGHPALILRRAIELRRERLGVFRR